jgi:beta-lactam-binding protein with PASTA domain
VPDARLKSPVEATALVEGAGLKAWFPTVPAISGADTGMNGYSIQSQDPAPGTQVDTNSTITLTLIRSGNGGGIAPTVQARVTVPDVRGLDPNSAVRSLTTLGLIVDIPPTDGRATLKVTSQSLTPGSSVTQGTHITINL